MNELEKTLLLCRNIPPAPTGASVVVSNLARQFGSNEIVVVGAYYVGCPPQTWRPEWPRLKYATLQPPDGWRGARWIRWAQWPLLLARAWWALVTERCQSIVVVFPDEVFLLAAYVLSLLTGRPLFPYMHNTYLENRPNSRLARWLQPRVFSRSRHVFVMSEGMQRLYQENYPGMQCSPLVHSFNETLPDLNQSLPSEHEPLRLVMFGNISASNAEATARIVNVIKSMENVHLTLFSGTSRSYLKQLGVSGDNIAIKTVSYDVLMAGIREGDVIVLPHGFRGPIAEQEIATIFPTRTIEALISQRPILAHTPKDCFFTEFLQSHGCALLVTEPDPVALARAIEQLRHDGTLRSSLVRQALLTARLFQASTVAEHFRSVLMGEPGILDAAGTRADWSNAHSLSQNR